MAVRFDWISIAWSLPLWLPFHLINAYAVLVVKYFESHLLRKQRRNRDKDKSRKEVILVAMKVLKKVFSGKTRAVNVWLAGSPHGNTESPEETRGCVCRGN